ncbi:hypothetical protein [Citrobacter phage IME-JL8]|uniref:Uncharacterized protein n=2 Tax=Sertoctavirus SRT8 TaxID=2560453 RepID=A0A6G6XTH0_9CAUD|nr:hypothetical protein FDI72_gp34 [Escherichia phage SRT8]ATN93811.1 hypothetical protein [Escherichia phage SRT8]QIG62017.1 hypothetical protein [Citrobacter phage IME-JL8]
MAIVLYILAAIAIFGFGAFCAFVVVAFALHHDAEHKTGVWLTYDRKRDEWDCFGDLSAVYAKAYSHHKPINFKVIK